MPTPVSTKTGMQNHRRVGGRSIRERLLVAFVLMVLLSAVGISVSSVIVGYINGSRQVQDRLNSVAALKTVAIENWANDLQNGLLIAVNDQSADARISIVLDLANSNEYYDWYNEAVRLRLRTLIGQSQQFEELCLIDTNGVVVLCTGSSQVVENCQDATFFQHGLAGPYVELPLVQPEQRAGNSNGTLGENGHSSAPCHFKPTGSGSPFIIAARPILGSQSQVLGIIAGRTSVGELTRILNDQTGLGTTGKAYLVGSGFARFPNVAASSSSSHAATPFPPSTGVETVLQNHSQTSGIFSDYQGVQVFGVYHWLPDLQVVLASSKCSQKRPKESWWNLGLTWELPLSPCCLP